VCLCVGCAGVGKVKLVTASPEPLSPLEALSDCLWTFSRRGATPSQIDVALACPCLAARPDPDQLRMGLDPEVGREREDLLGITRDPLISRLLRMDKVNRSGCLKRVWTDRPRY
jgi:hypothetical protein